MEWCILLTFVLLIQCPVTNAENYNDTKTLLTTLFDTNGYTNKIRPLDDQSGILNVTHDILPDGFEPYLADFELLTYFFVKEATTVCSVSFQHLEQGDAAITDFDEQEESLTTAGYLRIIWTDKSLVWDTSQYNGLTRLFIPQDDIWKPDISLRNSYDSFKGLGFSYQNAWVSNDGLVYWEPFQVFKSSCSVDITYFPYDTQTCELKFIAWSYTKVDINIQSHSGIVQDNYVESATWELVDSASESDNMYEASITYTLKVQRKPRFYVFNLILPVILLSLLNLFTFILPVSSGERASYGVTVFLSLTVFLTIVASEFPKNSDTISLLAVYLIMMISISTAYVLLSVIQLRIASRDNEKQPIGKYYEKFYNFVLVLQCKRCSRRPRQVDQLMVSEAKASKPTAEPDHDIKWTDVVEAMDFIFFWTGFIVTFLVTLILMLMLTYNPDTVTSTY